MPEILVAFIIGCNREQKISRKYAHTDWAWASIGARTITTIDVLFHDYVAV